MSTAFIVDSPCRNPGGVAPSVASGEVGVPEEERARHLARASSWNRRKLADGEPIQAVVPADRLVNLGRLLPLVGAETIRLASEDELDWLYPECERGAMPPFGPLYKQRVFVDTALAAERDIVFNAGTHIDAVCMRYDDFDDRRSHGRQLL